MGCSQDKRHWCLLSILPHLLLSVLCRKDSHQSCGRELLLPAWGTCDATSTRHNTRQAGGGPGAAGRPPHSRRIDEHISNDGRSNRTPLFIGEIHVTHWSRCEEGATGQGCGLRSRVESS